MAPDPGSDAARADDISESFYEREDPARDHDDAESIILSEAGGSHHGRGRLSRSSSFHSLMEAEQSDHFDLSEFEPFPARGRSFSEVDPGFVVGGAGAFGRYERFMQRMSSEIISVVSGAANAYGAERANAISALFENLKQHVEADVLEYLRADCAASPLASGSGPGKASPLAGAASEPPHYYELLAERFGARPEEAERLHAEMEPLWSNVHVPSIFALVFYRWLLEGHHEEEGPFVRLMNVFLKGTNRLFWYDLETSGKRFRPLFDAVRDSSLAGGPLTRGLALAPRFAADAAALVQRFFFHYEESAALRGFLAAVCSAEALERGADCVSLPSGPESRCTSPRGPPESRCTSPASEGPAHSHSSSRRPSRVAAAPDRVSAGSAFVMEAVRVVQLIRSERALLHYLDAFLELRGVERSLATDVKLQMALYSFTMPGGPMYPTRDVRHLAAAVMDALYPDGRRSRRLTAIAFRLLHPYYAVPSVFHWSTSPILRRARSLRRALAVRNEWLFGPSGALSRAVDSVVGAPRRALRRARSLATLPYRLTRSFWRAALSSARALLPARLRPKQP